MPKSFTSLESAVKKRSQGAIIMLELPEENYFESSSQSVKTLTDLGLNGVYISFQRPFNNVKSMLEQQKVNTDSLLFIDMATALVKEKQEKDPKCIHVSQRLEIDEIVRAIYTSLDRLKGKKFIFVDSLTTITLYKPLSEVMRLSEFLIRVVKKKDATDVVLVFNVSKDLTQKRFIKDIALKVDEVISVVR